MGQDRALQGEGLHRGMAGGLSLGQAPHYSVESKSSSLVPSSDAIVRRPESSCSNEGGASASRTAFGAWPWAIAKVEDGVSAMPRRAAAATKVCERQCAGSVSQR